MDKPIFLPADLYEQVLTFISSSPEACESLGIGVTSPARDDVVVGLGGMFDMWGEEHRSLLVDDWSTKRLE